MTLIRFGITTFVRQIACYVDLGALVEDLRRKTGTFSEIQKEEILRVSDKEEQAALIVLHMLKETKENLLKFCECVRKYSPLVANLIEYSNTDKTNCKCNQQTWFSVNIFE